MACRERVKRRGREVGIDVAAWACRPSLSGYDQFHLLLIPKPPQTKRRRKTLQRRNQYGRIRILNEEKAVGEVRRIRMAN